MSKVRSLKLQVTDLEHTSENFKDLRHRFLSSRDKMSTDLEDLSPEDKPWIGYDNLPAHCENCKYDATLYCQNRPRKDFKVYPAIYGLRSGVVDVCNP